ncbi:MAG: AAA domain-containing protein, partial [Solirubrobacteraceae bacterium]
MTELVAKFVAAFKRGVEGEVAAMRESAEAFEIRLTNGEHLGALRYRFDLPVSTERLVPGMVVSLRTPRGDDSASIERIDGGQIAIAATQPIDVTGPVALVVAPWFLYDRLVQALDRIDASRHAVSLALALFGKHAPSRAAAVLRCDHGALDASQRAAVQLCSESELAFVWGPPGTGKTVTLTHVIEELVAQGQRILLASTTNAAIDQVLAKLSGRAWFAESVAAGTLIRLGRSEAETFGA